MAVSDRTQDRADRAHVALQATWQIAGLFDALIEQGADLDDPDTIQESTVIRALALRGKALTAAAMSVLGDDLASVKDAQNVVDACESRVLDGREAANG